MKDSDLEDSMRLTPHETNTSFVYRRRSGLDVRMVTRLGRSRRFICLVQLHRHHCRLSLSLCVGGIPRCLVRGRVYRSWIALQTSYQCFDLNLLMHLPNMRFFIGILPAVTLLTQRSSASPLLNEWLQELHLVPRQGSGCTNVGAVYSESCWATLGLSDYILKWSPPKCVAGSQVPGMDGSACCEPDETWVRCFLRLARGDSTQTCDVINDQKCVDDGKLSAGLHPSIYHQVRYILKNIYDINNFFSTYWSGKYKENSGLSSVIFIS